MADETFLSSTPFSFALSQSIDNESIFSETSSPLLSGIISSLVLDIPLSGKQFDGSNTLPFNITTIQKFILAGDWSMRLDNIGDGESNFNGSGDRTLKVTGFTADFVGISKDGKGSHTHQISDFNPKIAVKSAVGNTTYSGSANSTIVPSYNSLGLDGDAHVLGTVDVGIDNQKIWENVKANITVYDGKTIEIMLDDKHIGYHFGNGQAIHGLVNGLHL
jgi:hypothetical protein